MNVKSIFDRYKVPIVDEKIYDPVRQINLRVTPEEIVRQKTIKFLMKRLGVPQSKIIVERGLNTLGVEGVKRRIDIGILDEEGLLMAIVECKAKLSKNGESAFIQAQDYLLDLNTRYFFVTDGVTFSGWYYDTLQNIQLDEIPKYERWYHYPTAE